MVLFPEVQKKAQAEIDAVVGPNRLPDFEDRPFLPYVNAIIKESMRWQLVAPLGKPFFIVMVIDYYHSDRFEAAGHMVTNDDEYDGYFIPKGTLVFGHSWPVLTIAPTFCPHFLV